MTKLFDGKSVFITGASSGIGAALAVEFAKHGAKVALAARRKDKLESVQKAVQESGGEAICLACDVNDRSSLDAAVAQTIEAFGGIDVAVANAGFGVSGSFTKLNTEDFRRQFDTNFFGVVDTIYAVLPHLLESKGRLGIVSSVLGKLGSPATAPYCASKFALCGLSESIYYDLADKGVSVTCLNPGIVESGFRRVDNQGVYHPDATDPAPKLLCVRADVAARAMLRTLYKRRCDTTITGHGKVFVFFHGHFPRTFRFLARMLTKGRLDKVEKSKRGMPT